MVKVTSKGLQTFIHKSESRKDEKYKLWVGKESINFHENCRKRYSALSMTASKRKRDLSLSPSSSSSIPDTPNDFNFQEYCFICNKVLDAFGKKVCFLKELYTYKNLLRIASTRNDEMGIEVLNRLQGISIEVSKPRYHHACYRIFVKIPLVSSEEIIEPYYADHESENEDTERHDSIEDVYNHIETSGKFQFFLSELQDILGRNIRNAVLCKKLKDKYYEDIFILEHRGRETVVYYK